MNPSSATSLYLSTCRAALRCDPQVPESFTELYNLLPFFRDALSCLVCGNLLQDPVTPLAASCQHCICRGCEGDILKLKMCSCCRNAQQFEDNKHLQVLVGCYRSLCEYVWVIVTAEQSMSRVTGHAEVMNMLEEVLGMKEELDVPQENLDSTEISETTAETGSISQIASEIKTDSKAVLDDQQKEHVPSSTEVKIELDSFRPVLSPGFGHNLAMQQISTEAIAISVSNGNNGSHCESTDQILLTVEEVLNSLESDCPSKLAKLEAPPSDIRSSVEPIQTFRSTPSGAVAPAHPQQPQTGTTCQTTSHRKVQLSRKRSRSESDSEMLQPLPITSFTQKPSVAATVPPQAAFEPKAPKLPTVPQNGAVLKVSKAVLDSTKNIQKNTESIGPKKVPTKTKVSTPKPKPKPKVSDGVHTGNPPKVAYKKPPEKKGCKCGRATQNPSVLTCRGQRCPCYSNRKACLDCICRGCQNSYMANGEKKLEAFAVPEKALEQTRLTLGINLTSISVMSASSNPGVLSLSAGPSMAAFLSSSPEKEPSFEDPLEMHFDC
ncbi:E3 ubiquitin-protein ligase MSL2a [Astyanax mexicanus]|uniref:E3 ubiquitin-protein ligase MSL2a n=1 Tax=Astyanax mexicanus TaxID=7994 RepID=UPI0020CAC0AF|nr:E3 ubiquitin-protein ligase MSL2a [Astyanax mexicanus]